jgi:hypothetical protein
MILVRALALHTTHRRTALAFASDVDQEHDRLFRYLRMRVLAAGISGGENCIHCPALPCPALPCPALHCTALHCAQWLRDIW